jgi:hypothetical protein
VPDFYFLGCVGDSAGSVFEKCFLLFGFHQPEEFTRLGVIIIIVFSEIPAISRTF